MMTERDDLQLINTRTFIRFKRRRRRLDNAWVYCISNSTPCTRKPVNATLHLYAMAITRLNSSDVRAVASGCPQCRNSVDHDGGFFIHRLNVVRILNDNWPRYRYIWFSSMRNRQPRMAEDTLAGLPMGRVCIPALYPQFESCAR